MKVLHLIPYYLPAYKFGGPVFSVHNLCKGLVLLGIDVEVWTTNLGLDFKDKKEEIIDGVKITYFPIDFNLNYAFSNRLYHSLKKDIKRFDLIHINGIYQFHSIAGSYFSIKNNIPFILSPRGMLLMEAVKKKGFLRKWIYIKIFEQRAFQYASKIHCTTYEEKKGVCKFGIDEGKIFVIPNPLEIKDAVKREEIKLPKGKRIILFLGRINWKKGFEILIHTFDKVKDEIKDVHLVIAGPDDGYIGKLRNLIKEKNLENFVTLTGELDQGKKVYAYENSEIFVLPSYSENFGVSVAEACFYKLPVVISKFVGMKEFIEKYNCGFISDLNVESFSECIKYLLGNEGERKKMGEKGRNMVLEEFDILKLSEKMKNIYEEVII